MSNTKTLNEKIDNGMNNFADFMSKIITVPVSAIKKAMQPYLSLGKVTGKFDLINVILPIIILGLFALLGAIISLFTLSTTPYVYTIVAGIIFSLIAITFYNKSVIEQPAE